MLTNSFLSLLQKLARVARIFLSINSSCPPSLTNEHTPHERLLRSWAENDLPHYLQFNQENLSAAVARINSPVSRWEKLDGSMADGGPAAGGEDGFGFACIHTAAEVRPAISFRRIETQDRFRSDVADDLPRHVVRRSPCLATSDPWAPDQRFTTQTPTGTTSNDSPS
jgi:hypothetical protein